MKVLSAAEWQARAAAHERRVDAWVQPHLRRRDAGVKHPVEDFLFTYYSYRPGRFRRWHPGAGVILAGASGLGPEYREVRLEGEQAPPEGEIGYGSTLDLDHLLPRRKAMIESIRALLAATLERSPYFGCFGIHEWAMVHRVPASGVRHAGLPLRLTPERIAEHVERREVRCTHYDAYRFFTPAARPLNVLRPERDTVLEFEQPGCLHTNMDLYKWAYKLSPLIAGELVADCFELAMDVRILDMRASPYDVSAMGHAPVRVELPEGRAEYAALQREFAERAEPLRRTLLAECDRLIESAGA